MLLHRGWLMGAVVAGNFQDEFGEAGAIEVIVSAIANHSTSADVVEAACMALTAAVLHHRMFFAQHACGDVALGGLTPVIISRREQGTCDKGCRPAGSCEGHEAAPQCARRARCKLPSAVEDHVR